MLKKRKHVAGIENVKKTFMTSTVQTVIRASTPGFVWDDEAVLWLTAVDATPSCSNCSTASTARLCSVTCSAVTHRWRRHLCVRRQRERLATCCSARKTTLSVTQRLQSDRTERNCTEVKCRLDVDMDIHGYIHGYYMLAHLLIKLNTYMLCLSIIISCLSFWLFILSFLYGTESNECNISTLLFS